MAKKPRPNKRKQLPTPKPCHNHPRDLISRIMNRQLNLWRNITSYGYVTKSWRSPPKKCIKYCQWPHLIEINTKNFNKNAFSCIFQMVFDKDYPFGHYRRQYNEWDTGVYFKGHSDGQKVQLFSDWIVHFLSFDRNRVFKTYNLRSTKNGRSTIMVITGSSSPAFAFVTIGNDHREWIAQDCEIKEPYFPSQNMQFSNAIVFKGKFYALSLQGSLVVIEDIEGRWGVTAFGGNRAVPSKVSRQFRECLFEFDGEILLVFLISRKCIDDVDDVEVFRLDFEKLLWVKVESLGDRTLFLEDGRCMWVDARMVGCKKNCVYFSHFKVDNWSRFDVGSGRIEPAFGNGVQEFDEDRGWLFKYSLCNSNG